MAVTTAYTKNLTVPHANWAAIVAVSGLVAALLLVYVAITVRRLSRAAGQQAS